MIRQMNAIPFVENTIRSGRGSLKVFVEEPHKQLPDLLQALREQDWEPIELSVIEASFYDFFRTKGWKELSTEEDGVN